MTDFEARIKRFNDAVELKEPDRVPVVPMIASAAQRLNGSSYRDLYYDYDRAGQAAVDFYKKYMPDATTFSGFTSGRANEIAETKVIDWPGRPGSKISIYSSHQVMEYEFMTADEYPELLNDFTGFMLNKYVPRVFPGLKGLGNTKFYTSIILNTGFFRYMCTPEASEAYLKLVEIQKEHAIADAATARWQKEIGALGLPPAWTGAGEAPYDILGDYFRGTMGMFDDLIENEDYVVKACDLFADLQIESFEYFKRAKMPVKRVFFPLHKGMDGFMSPEMYEKVYWKPLKKVFLALVDMGVTPVAYSEGKYNTRIEQLRDFPKGKMLVHFESADMARAKKILGDTACISGNLPIYLLEHGTPEQVSDYCKYLIDTCAPGGGYIFDTDACVEDSKPENMDAMFETLYTYGGK